MYSSIMRTWAGSMAGQVQFFTLEEASQVEINIINSIGFQIESNRRNYLSGTHQFNWNPTGHSPGIYYYMVQTGERQVGGKMLLVE